MHLHLLLKCGQPFRVWRRVCCKQAIALPHRGLIPGRMHGMIWDQRQGQPVQKLPALRCAFHEQPVHGRRQPDDRQPFRKSRG
jgi:hypothetical protein